MTKSQGDTMVRSDYHWNSNLHARAGNKTPSYAPVSRSVNITTFSNTSMCWCVTFTVFLNNYTHSISNNVIRRSAVLLVPEYTRFCNNVVALHTFQTSQISLDKLYYRWQMWSRLKFVDNIRVQILSKSIGNQLRLLENELECLEQQMPR